MKITNTQWKSLIFGMILNVIGIQAVNAVTVSSPILVGKGIETGLRLDGSLSVLPPISANTSPRWLGTMLKNTPSGLFHSMTTGPIDNPYQSQDWLKRTCDRASNNTCIGSTDTNKTGPAFVSFATNDVVDLWFMGIYRPNPTDSSDKTLLAFVHEERVGGTGGSPTPTGQIQEGITKIGLAISKNNGDTWNYLGRIISTSNQNQHNIQGAPYIISGGYFYVYYNDDDENNLGMTAVARALVSVVVDKATSGTGSAGNDTTNVNLIWKKLTKSTGDFTASATSDVQAASIDPNEVIHTQATQSSNGKYYLLTTQIAKSASTNSPTFVKLYQSNGPQPTYSWTNTAIGLNPSGFIANENYESQVHAAGYDGGYQYCSIVDSNGALAGQAKVGLKFFVYCQKQESPPLATNNPDYLKAKVGLYRWEVNLDTPNIDNFSRQSAGFPDTSQPPKWAYQYGGSGPLTNMAYQQGGYFQGSELYTRIYKDTMHPGVAEVPVLKWIAPKNGTVLIEGTVRKSDVSCGDGVTATISYSGGTLSPAFNNIPISFDDNLGVKHSIKQTVTTGQALFFIVGAKGNNYCDSTMWDPSVTYQ